MWLSSLTAEQRHHLLKLAHFVVESDGVLDPNEELMIDEFRREMALSSDFTSDTLDIDSVKLSFGTQRERVIVVLNLLRLSYVDGTFDVEEECLLKEIAQAFGLSDESFRAMDVWVKRLVDLEHDAQVFMRS